MKSIFGGNVVIDGNATIGGNTTIGKDCNSLSTFEGKLTTKGEVRLNTACTGDTYIYQNLHVGTNGGNTGKNLYVGGNTLSASGGFGTAINGGYGSAHNNSDCQVLGSRGNNNPAWVNTVSKVTGSSSITVTSSVATGHGNVTVDINNSWLENKICNHILNNPSCIPAIPINCSEVKACMDGFGSKLIPKANIELKQGGSTITGPSSNGFNISDGAIEIKSIAPSS